MDTSRTQFYGLLQILRVPAPRKKLGWGHGHVRLKSLWATADDAAPRVQVRSCGPGTQLGAKVPRPAFPPKPFQAQRYLQQLLAA